MTVADQALSSLIIDVRPGERLAMSGCVTIEVLKKSGRISRLRVTAPRDVRITKDPPEKRSEPSGLVASMAT